MPIPIKAEIQIRVFELAQDPSLSAAEIHRMITGGSDGREPMRVSYPAVVRLTREARSRPGDLTASGMAGRILTLLNRELVRIEGKVGSVDLDKLDRIAKTLRTVEPIRPEAKKKEAPSLRSLVAVQDEQGAGQG